MIRKNVDVVAIAVLLAVIALYSEARQLMLLDVVPNHGIVLAGGVLHQVFNCLPDAPPVPPLPPLAFSRE